MSRLTHVAPHFVFVSRSLGHGLYRDPAHNPRCQEVVARWYGSDCRGCHTEGVLYSTYST